MGAQAVRLSNVDIDNALKNKDFEVLFQPIFDLGNGALARMESFVRWRHPNLGLLPPGAFISFFESQGRMSELTRYVLDNAITAYTSWRGPFAPGISVNLALSDLSDDAFSSHFVKLLRDHEFPADLITLECPMPPVDMPLEKASEHFKRLSETGARLAIEVRGRANDLLRSLDPFPFDEIKTGGSSILRFARTVRGPGLSAIADLLDVANDANAAITAVGVEDQASLSALKGLGFTAAQGNHLGKVGDLKDFRPQGINEVRKLLELDPLSPENIAALFRTEAPEVQAPVEKTPEETEGQKTETEDALINRLNERVAQFDYDEDASAQDTTPPEQAAAADSEKKAKAREKAKALMLAKKAKARAERKAAAIERAKAKANHKESPREASDEDAASSSSPSAPRELQERLSEAFKPGDVAAQTSSAVSDADTPSEAAATAETAQTPETSKPAAPQQDISANEAGSQTTDKTGTQGLIAPEASSDAVSSEPSGNDMATVKLAVGPTSAYMQKVIRVGAPALPGTPRQSIPPSQPKMPVPPSAQPTNASPQTPAQPTPTAMDGNSESKKPSTVERAMASLTPEQSPVNKSPAPQPNPPGVTEDSPQNETIIGDLNKSDDDAEIVEARPRKKRKPFLKRTVIPISGYFWPRSWRRAWKRREAAKLAREIDDAVTNEKVAAE
ncbi:EAL domain-containing protein [Hyphococcus flavus]|uniref:EAL domain-containing protein n=1 Tax=Hyphococcus flavus TaxID=1866326 RepID=A0AAE9ZDM4_9PROT|nr:EAL domain-containing protein [Hyphococcus flavus]WDI30572.1 EAL domain-containing protein [Hyphococcus flavus]